jgi:hypothetical protein
MKWQLNMMRDGEGRWGIRCIGCQSDKTHARAGLGALPLVPTAKDGEVETYGTEIEEEGCSRGGGEVVA